MIRKAQTTNLPWISSTCLAKTFSSYFRTGLYPAPSFPHILGREASGEIVATGSGGELHGFAAGDRVVYMGTGAYAEYTALATTHVAKVPAAIKSDVAAAAALQGLTALTLIREAHLVKKGDWVLVHAAAGGVGLWLCQLLRAVGAHTIGTASTEAKIQLAKENGAEVLINYSKEDVVEKVKEVTNGQGVVAVFDGVGKSTFDISLESLARKGSMVSFGNASGAVPPLTISYVDSSLTYCVVDSYRELKLTVSYLQPPLGEEREAPPAHSLWLRQQSRRVRTVHQGTLRAHRQEQDQRSHPRNLPPC